MCGFCGIYDREGAQPAPEILRRMADTLAHRGPDDVGTYAAPGIGLGHRRLAILDLSSAGSQPMSLHSSGVTVSYNGEIYNFAELRSSLISAGCQFKSNSDTEVILHTYVTHGLEGLRKLEGIFAFALWDPALRRLLLMRDRLGVKPLYYMQQGDKLLFGSEIKAIASYGALSGKIDSQALAEYLWYGNSYEERTIYEQVRVLPPGSWLILEPTRKVLEHWWRVEDWLNDGEVMLEREEAANEVRRAIDKAVARQLVADVPVGLFLSGGIDSSVIAASAVAARDTPISSYSVAFDFKGGVNELPKARKVADHLRLDHHEMRISGGSLPDILLELAGLHDEPFADAANIPLYLLAREIKGAIKVVLQGDGGDEMFAGYRRYALLANQRAWQMVPRGLAGLIRKHGDSGRRLARLITAMTSSVDAERMGLLLTMESKSESPFGVLVHERRTQLERETDAFSAYKRCANRFRAYDPVQRMLLTDITLQLPSQFLTKVDRATMAMGIEARVPLLDETVGRLAVGLPASWKVKGSQKKIILRDAFRARLPGEILDGPKTGFGVPYEYWLRTSLYDLARDCILEAKFVDRFQLERATLARYLTEHRNNERDRGFILWKLLQLSLWARQTA